MLDALSVPPRLVLRALDDLHVLAEALRRLTERDGQMTELLDALRVLPRTEDELSAAVAELRVEVQKLHAWLQPLHTELTDLDDTAEKLEAALARTDAAIAGLHQQIVELRDKIPGF